MLVPEFAAMQPSLVDLASQLAVLGLGFVRGGVPGTGAVVGRGEGAVIF